MITANARCQCGARIIGSPTEINTFLDNHETHKPKREQTTTFEQEIYFANEADQPLDEPDGEPW